MIVNDPSYESYGIMGAIVGGILAVYRAVNHYLPPPKRQLNGTSVEEKLDEISRKIDHACLEREGMKMEIKNLHRDVREIRGYIMKEKG